MSRDQENKPQSEASSKKEREDRLADALRENLKKRKAQARGRKDEGGGRS